MASVSKRLATVDDLARHDGAAELVAGRIFRSLADFVGALGSCEAYTGNIALHR